MVSKNQAKFIRSLQMKKFREIHSQFTAEGTRLVLDLLSSRIPVITVYATMAWLEEHPLENKAVIVEASPDELSGISFLTTAPPVIGLFGIPAPPPSNGPALNELVLVLDDIRDPGNLGTIIRIADWFGIRRVICSETTVDLYNPKVVQATMGSIARAEVVYTDIEKWLSELSKETGIFGTCLDGENIYSLKLPRSGVIIVGNESEGISPGVMQRVTGKLFIPSFSSSSHAESLNASVATAIVCAEFRRQSVSH